MPSINLDTNYPAHKKTKRLMKLISPEADIYPVRLWAYCGNHHADGILKDYTTEEIEDIMGWRGETGKLLSALLEVQFLKKVGSRGRPIKAGIMCYAIWDFSRINGHLKVFKERAITANKVRWSNYRRDEQTSLKDTTRTPPRIEMESSIPTIPNKEKTTIAENRKTVNSAEYMEAVDLLLRRWILNGSKYPFCKLDGHAIKRLLGYYGRPKTLALIELFWEACDDWTRTNIGRNMRGLQHSLAKLLENPKLKSLEAKYSGPLAGEMRSLPGLKSMPRPEDAQRNKVEAMEKLQQ
jgi:hypothetical protein